MLSWLVNMLFVLAVAAHTSARRRIYFWASTYERWMELSLCNSSVEFFSSWMVFFSDGRLYLSIIGQWFIWAILSSDIFALWISRTAISQVKGLGSFLMQAALNNSSQCENVDLITNRNSIRIHSPSETFLECLIPFRNAWTNGFSRKQKQTRESERRTSL